MGRSRNRNWKFIKIFRDGGLCDYEQKIGRNIAEVGNAQWTEQEQEVCMSEFFVMDDWRIEEHSKGKEYMRMRDGAGTEGKYCNLSGTNCFKKQ